MIRMLQSLCLLACFVPVCTLADEPAPHQTGLIDMAHVFNHYEKFTALKSKLQAEIENSDAEAQAKMDAIKQYQTQLTNGTITSGSAEFNQVEAILLKSQTELENFRLSTQRDFLRKEAEVYKTVYLEVQNAVKLYAEYYKFTLILRFTRENIADVDNPRDVINGMNRQVIFHRHEHDITDPILDYLNTEWRKQSAESPVPASLN